MNYTYALGPPIWETEYYKAPDNVVGWIDLRSVLDSSVPNVMKQCGFFAFNKPPSEDYAVLTNGDLRESYTTSYMLDTWESITGYRPQGDTLNDLLFDHLTNGSDPDGLNACKPLMPTVNLNLDVHLGGHSLIKRVKFKFGKHFHSEKIKDVLQKRLLKIRQDAHESKIRRPIVLEMQVVDEEIDHEFHRRVATAICEKYNIKDFEDIRPKDWDKSETLLPHSTIITDDFNRANQSGLGTSAEGWSWEDFAAGANISNNRAVSTTDGAKIPIAAIDLATDDHYSQAAVFPTSSSIGLIARKDGLSTNTFYNIFCFFGSTWRTVKRVNGTGTVLGSSSSASLQNGTIMKLECDGSSISRYRNGQLQTTVTDTAIENNLRCGLYLTGTSQADDFEAGDLHAPEEVASNFKFLENGMLSRSRKTVSRLGWLRPNSFTSLKKVYNPLIIR